MGCCPVFRSHKKSLTIAGTPKQTEKKPADAQKEIRKSDLTFEQVQEIVRAHPDSYLIIDVRRPEEVEERGKLPRAVNLPLQEIDEAMAMTPDEFEAKYGFAKVDCKGEGVIVYCCRGFRATEAKEKFKEAGLKCVQVYSGYLDYTENGGFVERA